MALDFLVFYGTDSRVCMKQASCPRFFLAYWYIFMGLLDDMYGFFLFILFYLGGCTLVGTTRTDRQTDGAGEIAWKKTLFMHSF